MKTVLFLLVCIASSCAVYPQKGSDILRIEFTSLSRGGYSKQVVITSDSINLSYSEGREAIAKTTEKLLNSTDWMRLVNSLKGVSIAEISDLTSPTMKRAYDGARHSSITLVTANGKSATHSFDDENPHQKLQLIIKVIQQLTEKYSDK